MESKDKPKEESEELTCPKCNYNWESKSKALWVTCPNCMSKFKREKEEDKS